jgi:hypothetical protein
VENGDNENNQLKEKTERDVPTSLPDPSSVPASGTPAESIFSTDPALLLSPRPPLRFVYERG